MPDQSRADSPSTEKAPSEERGPIATAPVRRYSLTPRERGSSRRAASEDDITRALQSAHQEEGKLRENINEAAETAEQYEHRDVSFDANVAQRCDDTSSNLGYRLQQ